MKHITKAAVVAMADPKEWLRITPDDRLRFAVKLRTQGPHMVWTGATNRTYGAFKFRSATKDHPAMIVGAHVFAYYNTHSLFMPSPGEIGSFDVAHTCTEHMCCEPLHLYLATHTANMQERFDRELETVTI
jgi:hypothetical protein